MHKTTFSGHSNVDTDIADYDDHFLESLFAGRTKSGIIYLGPDEMASKHKIRVNLKIGTKNTRIGVPRELDGWMKTTLYRDNTTLRWILFEDRVAPRHHRQLPDGDDRCVCMLQPARTTADGVSYMASCRTAMSPGQQQKRSAQEPVDELRERAEGHADNDVNDVQEYGAQARLTLVLHARTLKKTMQTCCSSEFRSRCSRVAVS